MKKAIFAMAIATMIAVSCTTGTDNATANATDSTLVKVDSTAVDSAKTTADTTACCTPTVK